MRTLAHLRSSHPEVLLCNFIEIALQHGCFPVNLLHILRTPFFLKNISGWLLLSLAFSDVTFRRKNDKFIPSVYKKLAFSGGFTDCESFISLYQKRGLMYTLLHKNFKTCCDFNLLSASPTKWSNILKQFVGNLPTNCLSVFDHFVGLALKGLKYSIWKLIIY